MESVLRVGVRPIFRPPLTEIRRFSGNIFDKAAKRKLERSTKITKYIIFVIAFPLIGYVGYRAYYKEQEHLKHRPPFIEYDYLYSTRYLRKLPFGDGIRTLLHNPKRNALPGIGYETPDPAEEEAEKQRQDDGEEETANVEHADNAAE